MCEEMEGGVPYSMDHGDLHSANIPLVNDEIVFFDWGDATGTHPFFSTRIFWNYIDDLVASESEWLQVRLEYRELIHPLSTKEFEFPVTRTDR